MTILRGLVQSVETIFAGDFLTADQAIGATVLPVASTNIFDASGTVAINGETHTYGTVDPVGLTITISPGLVAAATINDGIFILPLASRKIAYVSMPDSIGDAMSVRVPHNLKAYSSLTDGPRDPGTQESVHVQNVGGELVLLDVIGEDDQFDASNTPIVTSTAGGERVQIDGNGITLYTNDPVQQLSFTTIGLPIGVAVDSAGIIYVADQTNSRVRKFFTDGSQITSGGFPITVTGGVQCMTLDSSGNIYTGSNTAVRKFNTSGTQTLTFATTTASGIAVDASGNIYVSDNSANLIRKYNSAGTAGITISTTGLPLGVAVDASGNIYTNDNTNGLIRVFNPAGTQILSFSIPGGQSNGIAVDAAGFIYVAAYNSAYKFTAAGVAVSGYPFGFGNIGGYIDIALDASGNIYTADQSNFLIRKINNPGTVISSGQLITAFGRLLVLDGHIAGNLEVDSISSANGLQITSPVTMLQKTQSKTDVTVASGTGTTTVVVTYDVAFLTKPGVFFTPKDAKLTAPTVTASSTTGFTVQWSRSATGTYTFDWVAIAA